MQNPPSYQDTVSQNTNHINYDLTHNYTKIRYNSPRFRSMVGVNRFEDFTFGDTYGIDTSTIFIGGYSAGAITSLHLAYVDDISE